MLASIPSQHLESDCPPCRNPKRDSTSTNHALMRSLVEAVTLHPNGDRQRMEVRGELAACRLQIEP